MRKELIQIIGAVPSIILILKLTIGIIALLIAIFN